MSETYASNRAGGAVRFAVGAATATGAADWLSLAAAPTFAVMALLTAAGAGQPELLCSAHLGSPFGGMVPMYLLMSVFHSGQWLRLILRRQRHARSSH